jgi:hypothetical protein
MVWVLLAAIGVPVWIVVGLLIGALYHRSRAKRWPGVFKAKLRRDAGETTDRKAKWRGAYGLWVHDVPSPSRASRRFDFVRCRSQACCSVQKRSHRERSSGWAPLRGPCVCVWTMGRP